MIENVPEYGIFIFEPCESNCYSYIVSNKCVDLETRLCLFILTF